MSEQYRRTGKGAMRYSSNGWNAIHEDVEYVPAKGISWRFVFVCIIGLIVLYSQTGCTTNAQGQTVADPIIGSVVGLVFVLFLVLSVVGMLVARN